MDVQNREKSNDNECFYLHMVIPSKENDEQQTVLGSQARNNGLGPNSPGSSNSGKKAFYEVGCKIFEINKIYK